MSNENFRQQDHEERIVAQFTRWAVPFAALPIHADEESMARMLEACCVSEGMEVLDVACGPGIVACALAAQGATVVGVDLTPAMIDVAQRRAQEAGLPAEFREGNALALPFAAASFDRVVTRYSFHHMREPGKVLAEMVRVCRPGGRIVVIDATPEAEAQKGYDLAETMRDPSHTSALTLEQLLNLGEEFGLRHVLTHRYRLEARVQDQVTEENRVALEALFENDIADGENRLGVWAWKAVDGIRFFFPISVVAWDCGVPD